MISLLVFSLLLLISLYIANTIRCFRQNLALAKASNIHYVIVPIYSVSTWWLTTHRIWMPYLRELPTWLTHPWLDFLPFDWAWELQYAPFKRMGVDTFITVAPGGIQLWTADAAVIAQMTTRRNDFPKPIEIYRSVDLYGKNVVSSEGHIWRRHRKITSPPFTEKNNHMVWSESLHQAQSMIKSWVGNSGGQSRTIERVASDTMRLSLHIISRAGFGVRLLWPGVEDAEQSKEVAHNAEASHGGVVSSVGVSPGHSLSYTDALESLLHNQITVLLLPRFLLQNLPFRSTKVAKTSFNEWGKYMREMFDAKVAEVRTDTETEGMDLMGALVKGSGINQQASEKGIAKPVQALTDDEIIGNAFVFILAGHETTANAIHFSLLHLAMSIGVQRDLQKDLDSIFGSRAISEWDYECDLPKLFGGYTGAVMNETLRLVPPIICIPKCTRDQAQPITIDGKKCMVPANIRINLNSVATHRNPKFWPAGPPTDPTHPWHPTSNPDNDLEEFKPQRWLIDADSKQNGRTLPGETAKDADTDDLGVDTASDTAASLFRPQRGAYIPFSEGYRACLGRRFAQVQVLAVLAVIFSRYSVELAVDEYATDAEVEKMGKEERKTVWSEAKARTQDLILNGMSSVITLQMRKGAVPLRFVARGKERFEW